MARLQVDISGVDRGYVEVRRKGTPDITVHRKSFSARVKPGVYKVRSKPVVRDGWQYVTKKTTWRTVEVRPGGHRIVSVRYRPVAIPWDSPPLGEFSTMVLLVNDARREHGMKPVGYNNDIALAAQRFADDMSLNNYFSHVGTDGSTFEQRIKATPFRGEPAGENIASGFPDASSTFAGWMASQHHRSNILNPEFDLMGLGYAIRQEPGYTTTISYWVQDFGYQP